MTLKCKKCGNQEQEEFTLRNNGDKLQPTECFCKQCGYNGVISLFTDNERRASSVADHGGASDKPSEENDPVKVEPRKTRKQFRRNPEERLQVGQDPEGHVRGVESMANPFVKKSNIVGTEDKSPDIVGIEDAISVWVGPDEKKAYKLSKGKDGMQYTEDGGHLWYFSQRTPDELDKMGYKKIDTNHDDKDDDIERELMGFDDEGEWEEVRDDLVSKTSNPFVKKSQSGDSMEYKKVVPSLKEVKYLLEEMIGITDENDNHIEIVPGSEWWSRLIETLKLLKEAFAGEDHPAITATVDLLRKIKAAKMISGSEFVSNIKNILSLAEGNIGENKMAMKEKNPFIKTSGKRPLTVVPAYGRDYKTGQEAIGAWNASKDFQIRDMSSKDNGRYCGIGESDAIQKEGYDSIKIRFNKLRDVAIVELANGEEKQIESSTNPFVKTAREFKRSPWGTYMKDLSERNMAFPEVPPKGKQNRQYSDSKVDGALSKRPEDLQGQEAAHDKKGGQTPKDDSDNPTFGVFDFNTVDRKEQRSSPKRRDLEPGQKEWESKELDPYYDGWVTDHIENSGGKVIGSNTPKENIMNLNGDEREKDMGNRDMIYERLLEARHQFNDDYAFVNVADQTYKISKEAAKSIIGQVESKKKRKMITAAKFPLLSIPI